MPDRLNIAVVGLGFGAEFVPIHRDHPDVASVSICDSDSTVLHRVGDRFGVAERYSSLDEVLAQTHIDAVHLVTALPDHGRQSIAVLAAGKHCACTVPMAVDVEEMRQLIQTQRHTGKNYMMMETAVYTREFLHCLDLFESGAFGPITFAESVYSDGSHASFTQGGGHGGSHPHLVNEFVRSIIEERAPLVDAVTAANWTAPGLVAHLSALKGGEPQQIPAFD